MVITTSVHAPNEMQQQAQAIAARLNWKFVPREQVVFHSTTFVLEQDKLVLYSKDKQQRLFFHPSLAKHRILQHELDGSDSFLRATGLQQGESILDCTLGLATDAIVASYAVGESGNVIGLESEQVLAEVVRIGMAAYPNERLIEWKALLSRIQVLHASYKAYLRAQPERTVDVVYFDPMFSTPISTSHSISPLREWANFELPDRQDIALALQIAKRRVVMKSHKEDAILDHLGFQRIETKRTICFGYLDVVR